MQAVLTLIQRGWTKKDASNHVALGSAPTNGSGAYVARRLRSYISFYRRYDKLPESCRASDNSKRSLLFNEQFRKKFVEFVDDLKEVCMSVCHNNSSTVADVDVLEGSSNGCEGWCGTYCLS